MKFSIKEGGVNPVGSGLSNIFRLEEMGDILKLVNTEYYHSVAKCQPKLVLNIASLKYLDGMYIFNYIE